MTDRLFLRLSEDWALAFDRNQWIVCKRRKDCGRGEWQSIAFVASNKRVLMRVLKEKEVRVTPDAQLAITTMPERFLDWITEHRDQSRARAA